MASNLVNTSDLTKKMRQRLQETIAIKKNKQVRFGCSDDFRSIISSTFYSRYSVRDYHAHSKCQVE